ncbi:MAG: hypothetical protein PHQ91_13580 [Thermoanaerobaculaceae bacterium]|nr:hypothetical protein [Thermoanaerobaculaceae bacterium]
MKRTAMFEEIGFISLPIMAGEAILEDNRRRNKFFVRLDKGNHDE